MTFSHQVDVRKAYDAELIARGYSADLAQLRAVGSLERCAHEWSTFKAGRLHVIQKLVCRRKLAPRGVYMYGGVGRGKSFLLDCFFHSLPTQRKARLHFHEFMREVHRELANLQGTVNPLNVLAKRVATKHDVLCFDEFHVTDITDALILHRLLEALFKHGVGLVMTSNFRPDALYPNGMHRDRLLPAITLLENKLEVVNVDTGVDYRTRDFDMANVYHVPNGKQADEAMASAFTSLADHPDEDTVLQVESRKILARRKAGGVVWFDFDALCGGPRSQNDYLEIASRFHTIFLSDVPCMPVRMASQARRFTWLVDVVYDRRVKLIISAAVAPENLYTQGPLSHEFVRAVSRLHEMQSKEFLSLHRRIHDTALT